jgi:LPXTG-site transpeptidase (sortase) family protein
MKPSAPILVSFVVGALVAVAFVQWSVDGQAAAVPEPHVVPVAIHSSATRRRPRPAAPAVDATSPALISIPKLHLKATIGTDLNDGPAWWAVTGRPGGGDTIAVAGHRTTHTRPFYWLDRLQRGDAIYVRWQGQVHPYTVSGRRILSARDLHIADARGHEVLLLSACNPRGSARQRIVVYARPRQHA